MQVALKIKLRDCYASARVLVLGIWYRWCLVDSWCDVGVYFVFGIGYFALSFIFVYVYLILFDRLSCRLAAVHSLCA
jgi:hypothetical protein